MDIRVRSVLIVGLMVRPRASEANIRIALAFADIVTVQTRPGAPNDPNAVLVARKGRQSIFAAFSTILSGLARDSRAKRPKNRRGVALMELNKALKAAGLKSVRKRDRIDGGVRWRSKASLYMHTCYKIFERRGKPYMVS